MIVSIATEVSLFRSNAMEVAAPATTNIFFCTIIRWVYLTTANAHSFVYMRLVQFGTKYCSGVWSEGDGGDAVH